MPAKLISKSAVVGKLVKTIEQECTIGRGANTISIPGSVKAVSSKHARIWFDTQRGCYMLEDLGSLNGTELDGVPVTEPEPLGRLHVITLGQRVDFIFRDLTAAAAATTTTSVVTAPGRTEREPKAAAVTRPEIGGAKTEQETVPDARATRSESALPADVTRLENRGPDPRSTRSEGTPGKKDES